MNKNNTMYPGKTFIRYMKNGTDMEKEGETIL
jgi:hypothetical protein